VKGRCTLQNNAFRIIEVFIHKCTCCFIHFVTSYSRVSFKSVIGKRLGPHTTGKAWDVDNGQIRFSRALYVDMKCSMTERLTVS